jgi:hypothetical protein
MLCVFLVLSPSFKYKPLEDIIAVKWTRHAAMTNIKVRRKSGASRHVNITYLVPGSGHGRHGSRWAAMTTRQAGCGKRAGRQAKEA